MLPELKEETTQQCHKTLNECPVLTACWLHLLGHLDSLALPCLSLEECRCSWVVSGHSFLEVSGCLSY